MLNQKNSWHKHPGILEHYIKASLRIIRIEEGENSQFKSIDKI